MTESLRKLCRNTQKSSEISPDIPETATMEHTWIQRDSNFTSLRGLDSHLSL